MVIKRLQTSLQFEGQIVSRADNANTTALPCLFSLCFVGVCDYLAELFSYIQHALSEEVFHHHLIEKPLAVCLPAAIYSHTANIRIKILQGK